jgi:hypothetical protein
MSGPGVVSPPAPPVLGSYETLGCRVNEIEPEALLHAYDRAGFLYSQKQERIRPYLPLILDNLRLALRAGRELVRVVTWGDPQASAFASLMLWRNTFCSFVTQHLVCIGGPAGSRAVILGTQGEAVREGFHRAGQCWFSPENRFSSRVFGRIVGGLGTEHAAVYPNVLLQMPLSVVRDLHGAAVRVESAADPGEIRGFLQAQGRAVYAAAEELDRDLSLAEVDALYRTAGLSRTRSVRAAYLPGTASPAGIAVACRSPLGLNLSFLENRCDLILDAGLAPARQREAAAALLRAVAPAYASFEPGYVPVVCPADDAWVVEQLGGMRVREYCQSAWTSEAFVDWYRYVESLYARVDRAGRRRSETLPLVAPAPA